MKGIFVELSQDNKPRHRDVTSQQNKMLIPGASIIADQMLQNTNVTIAITITVVVTSKTADVHQNKDKYSETQLLRN